MTLPWVDDAELTAKAAERQVASNKQEQERLSGKTYEVKAGDNLWKIAMKNTSDKGRAARIVSEIMGLNPERLKVGASQEYRNPSGELDSHLWGAIWGARFSLIYTCAAFSA